MPIYEYQCTSCHHQFDLMQKVNDEPAQQCPQCFQNSLTKLVSAAGFQLKGTGWYATDFKDKGKPNTSVSATKSTESATAVESVAKDTATTASSDTTTSTSKGTTE